MQFVYPGFLWALALLAIPVIIHLFYFRRYRQVLFSNVRFLREIKEETSARNKLRNLLILLMRLLALTFLLIAFAQPFIPGSSQRDEGIQNVSIYIDNSFSMSAFGEDFSLLDQAKQRAAEIVKAYSIDDAFQVLTSDLAGGQQRTLSQEEALTRIADIDISPERKDLLLVQTRQEQWLSDRPAETLTSYWISDFQANTLTESIPVDTTILLQLVPLKAVRSANILIDSAWFLSPVQMLNETATMLIRVRNFGDQDADQVSLSYEVNGQDKPLGSISVPAGESRTDTARITILKTGWHRVTVRVSDFPVQFDDTYYLSFYVDESVKVLAVYEQSPRKVLAAAFRNQDFFRYENQSVNNLDVTAFSNYDLIVLDDLTVIPSGFGEALRQYIEAGGKVLVFPSSKADVSGYNRFYQSLGAPPLGTFTEGERTVGTINTDEFIFQDVFERIPNNLRLPSVKGSYRTADNQRSAGETLLAFRDGGMFLGKYRAENGFLYICSSPLDPEYSNLTNHAEIYVPLLYKAAIARNESQAQSLIIGKDQVLEVENTLFDSESVFEMTGPSNFIPGIRLLGARALLDVKDQVREAGFYGLRQGEETQAVFAFNYNRLESDLSMHEPEQLKQYLGEEVQIWNSVQNSNLTEVIKAETLGRRLWKWCIILALVFLAVETGIIRLWKH